MISVTRVGRYRVPVQGGQHPSLAVFTGGARGKHEAGVFAFWTAVLKRPIQGRRTVIVRTRVLFPPGERFTRFQRESRTHRRALGRRLNGAVWAEWLQRGAAIRYIRPATLDEMRRWMAGHQTDTQWCTWSLVGNPAAPSRSRRRPKPGGPHEAAVLHKAEMDRNLGPDVPDDLPPASPGAPPVPIELQGPDFPIWSMLRRAWRRVRT